MILLADKRNKGLQPKDFIAGMEKNQEEFQNLYHQFSWENSQDVQFFQNYAKSSELHCFILAADWCGDVVRNVPAVLRILETAEISTEILRMEEHTDTMDQFLTFGGRAVPKVIFTNQQGEVLADWGPRPAPIQEVMANFKQEFPERTLPGYEERIKEVYVEIRKRYAETNYQQIIVQELKAILSSL